jgi:branched-chain amino acid transport system ATP-binding protein
MAEPLLTVSGLDAWYDRARALESVSFSMGQECVCIIGRNGMGKSTLCYAVMGFTPPRATGSVRYRGKELVGQGPQRIARAGLGFVPQGRRLFPSLTVEEHLRIAQRGRGGEWTADRVYELFPRLAERRRSHGDQLSGGEQQMLAIGRALMTNPDLLVLDEPSEGLAPVVVDSLVAAFSQLIAAGHAILLVEQNLHVATTLADRLLVMVGGQLTHETTAAELTTDPDAQRRYLGVEHATGTGDRPARSP